MIRSRSSIPSALPGSRAFSLIEITLAMGIAAIAMVSILGMLPQALKASRASADQTAIGAVLEDIHDRMEGQVLEEGPVPGSPFFYDEQGRFWEGEVRSIEDLDPNLKGAGQQRFFRVEVELVRPRKSSSPDEVALPEDVLAARIAMSWPLDEGGDPVGPGNPRTTVTYPVSTLTGPDWKLIEPGFEAKIEY